MNIASLPSDPASRYREFYAVARKLPGVDAVQWSPREPDTLRILTRGPGWSNLVANVLEDSWRGAQIVIGETGDDGSGYIPPGSRLGFWDTPAIVAMAVAALPGVVDYRILDNGTQPVRIEFSGISAAAAHHLDSLVRDRTIGLDIAWRTHSA